MDINRIPPLTEEQRHIARANAQKELMRRLNSIEPQFDDYLAKQEHKYSKGVERALLVGIGALLLIAFILSAVHIYFSARSAYAVGVKDETLVIIAGFASVFFSEFMTVVFATAPSVLKSVMSSKVKTLCFVLALLSVVFAILGNATSAVLYQNLLSFNWFHVWVASFSHQPMVFLLSILPPVTVLGASYVLESVVLQSNSRHFLAAEEYNADRAEYENTRLNIDQHDRWESAYAVALWDVFVQASKKVRRYNTNDFTHADKTAFVQREFTLENWYDTVTDVTDVTGVTHSNTGAFESQAVTNATNERIEQYLLQHPEDYELSTRELGRKLGVSHMAVYRVKQELSENGNGYHEN